MELYGYAGRILYVDLTTESFKVDPLDPELVRKYIGGVGINNILAYKLIKAGIDPLSPENPLIIGAGLFSGTMIPGSSKVMLTTKFPMTGAVGTAVGGGSFGSMLKYAGYDHLVITGKAKGPVYLKIDNTVEICDATSLWRKDIFQVTEELWEKNETSSVIAIGVAGEKLVKPSIAMVDNIGTLGRGGLGAIMGAKNLKAIVACANKGIRVWNLERIKEKVHQVYERIRIDPLFDKWVKDGVRIGWPSWAKGEFGYKNEREIYTKEKALKLYESERFHDIMEYVPQSCLNCPIADKGMIRIKKGEFQGLTTYVAEFLQGMLIFGLKCNIGDDYNKMVKCLDVANRLGLDAFTAVYMLAYLDELRERGVITEKDTEGIEPKLGFQNILDLMNNTAMRVGFGDILAEGWKEIIRRIGKGAEKYAMVIKGMDTPYMDPRINFGTEAFEQLVNPRGAFVVQAESPTILPLRTSDKIWRHCATIGVPEETRDRIFDTPREFNVAMFTRYCEDWYHLLNILGLCARQQIVQRYNIEMLTELYTDVTGFKITPEQILRIAERAQNVGKMLNVREGFSRNDDKFLDRWFEPLKGDGRDIPLMDYYRKETLAKEDIEALLDDYYRERGWDIEKGIPTKEKLSELGLEDMM